MRQNISLRVAVAFIFLSVGLVAADEERWIPVAASNAGLHGSQWATDLWIFGGAGNTTIPVTVAFLPDAEGSTTPIEVTVDVPTGSTLEIVDVVNSLFGVNRSGALRLRSPDLFEARSRTYSGSPGSGTFGQGVAGLYLEQALEDPFLMGAANRPGPDGVRSNVGFVNPRPEPCDVRIAVIDQDTGEQVGVDVELELGPNGWFQDDIFDLVGAADQEVGNAIVAAAIGPLAEPIFGYLSRVDNRTNDGTFMLAFPGQTAPSTGLRMEINLTYSEGATIDTFTYASPDGSDITVDNPPSGWSATLIFPEPLDWWCYVIAGEMAEGGGWVTLIGSQTPSDGSMPGIWRRTFSATGAGPIQGERCRPLP